MLDFWVKFKEIELYVEHEVDNPIIVDDIFCVDYWGGEGDVEGVEVDGKDDDEGVESSGEGDVGEVQADGEGVSATGMIEVDKDIGMESGGHISLGSTVGEDNNSEVAGNEYASDFATSDGVDNVADEYVGDFATSDRVDNVADKYAGDFATSDGLDNVAATRSGEEEDGNETEVWDSDEHGSLVQSDDEMKNMKMFSLGMLFKDGKQFKSAIRKYSKECRRQLKFIKNEPKRVVVRCIASPNCPWRIRASYSPVAKCLQIKTFQDEHYFLVSFKNKMVTAAMIAQHFEATIKDHPKMKLREIQRRCASEMHVNVTIDCCYRERKIVNEKMAGNHRMNLMPGSTIKMAIQRVTADSLPHFRFYYPFKSEFLTTHNQPNVPIAGLWLKWSALIHGAGFSVSCQLIWAWKMGMGTQLSVTNKRALRLQFLTYYQGWSIGIITKCTTEKDLQRCGTRAFLGTTCKLDIVDNNLCEAFNSSIVEAKFKSIIRMLEDIRTKMMTRIVQKRKLCNGWKQNYGPLVKAKFDANKKDCVEWQLIWNGENGCELRKGSYQYTVDLSQRICSCRSWQISGIPCSHACAAMYHLGLQPDEYLHEYYHIDTYKKAYSFPMQPINGPHDWEKTGIQPVLPPIERKMPGRPKRIEGWQR
ncbi:hypothetical protein CXB51_025783 [Gossypium anomalum]|uniref:SWIM-type domain-containing protein n=1 Tax=Gossypium anomalum TaxID=47600 RepID=A0A8J5Z4F9_9ROSI|nr:hypothetical protein CXB51_025783 [Gossypium anomalum]